MDIGILQCGHTSGVVAERHGDFDTMFEALLAGHGLRFFYYDVEHMVFPGGVCAHDGWLVTGSKHGAYEDHEFIPPLEDFIRAAFAAGVPQVGICFGHQIIAQAMGARVEKFKGGWSIGRQVYRMGDRDVALNAWHQDQVLDLPEGAEIVASSDFCAYAGLRYGDKAYTLQPHPEFSNAIVTDYVASRRGTLDYAEDRMAAAEAALGLPLDQDIIAQQIADFFLRAHTREMANG